jgi:hypothetical protein
MSLIMQSHHVEFIEGAESMRSWDTQGADGRIKRCHFCPNCGTRIMHGSDDPGQSVSIKAGSLDNTRDLQPSAHIWLQSAQPWLAIDREHNLCFEAEPEDYAVLAKQQPHESDNA